MTQPLPVAALFRRGVECQSQNRIPEAAQWFFQVLRAEPKHFEALYNLGLLLQRMNQRDGAMACYQQALALRPDFAPAWNNLGVAYRDAGRWADAIACYRRALRLQPDAPDTCNNLGNALRTEDQLAEAIHLLEKSVRRAPANPRVWHNLGNARREAGRLEEATAAFEQALALAPDLAEAHWDLAFVLLLHGRWARGWAEYEWRWRRPDIVRRAFLQPEWRGEDLAGKTILVHAEQGLGDTLQFSRYLPLVAKTAGRVLFECPPAVAGLMESIEGVARVLRKGEPLPDFDLHVPLLSLPRCFQTQVETVPGLAPRRAGVSPRTLLPPPAVHDAPLKVGLAWAGNPNHVNDRRRSLPPRFLEPLLRERGVAFYSLQVGQAGDWAAHSLSGPPPVDLRPLIRDFVDTAVLMGQLDLIISVDTSTAHLAGFLGRPVWTLLPFAPDWRWLLGRSETPWYPTMCLLRQPRPGDWASVIEEVQSLLRQRVS